MSFNSLADLKANRQNILSTLRTKVEKMGTFQANEPDARFWRPDLDKAGNGSAVIRFLRQPKSEEYPFVMVYNHGFQGPGGWYIENSLTSIGEPDPVAESNNALWNTGTDANKDIVRQRKRKLTYISNVLIINDPKHPENNGKVFLFKYGKKIFEKVKDCIEPKFADQDPFDPFCFWGGANFKLRISRVAGFINYDSSAFDPPAPLCGGDDDKIDAIWSAEYGLKEFLDRKNFKSYQELKAKFLKVIGGVGGVGGVVASTPASVETAVEPDDDEVITPPKKTAPKVAAPVASPDDEEEGDDFFAALSKAAVAPDNA